MPDIILLHHGNFCRLLDSPVIFGDTQAEKKGKASRKVLEHALTRAALEPDLAAIDKAEVELSHKLESFFSRKGQDQGISYTCLSETGTASPVGQAWQYG
ncbi:TPA: hypothetical protein ACH3X1_014539 [Trebouxia sp. C0004]